MRTFDFDIAAGLPALITIQYGLITIRFTSHGEPITVDGETWEPAPGCALSNIQFPSDGSPSNADVQVMAVEGGIIEPGDARRGLFDNWPITIDLVDVADPENGLIRIVDGIIGAVDEDSNGVAMIAANGPLRQAQMRSVVEHYALTGREILGDDRCKIPILAQNGFNADADLTIDACNIQRETEYVTADNETGLLRVLDCFGRARAVETDTVEDFNNIYFEAVVAGITGAVAPVFDFTPEAMTVDGTVTFQAKNSWLRNARGEATDEFTIVLEALPDPRAGVSGWYELGGVYIRSGLLSGTREIPIRLWDPSTLTITLALPVEPDDIPANTQMELRPGCDYTPAKCASFTNLANPSGTNIENIRAEYFVPTPDLHSSVAAVAMDTETATLKERVTLLEAAWQALP